MKQFDDLLISVIIPVYNGELYLTDALQSVAAQNYQNLEIIVVDDGSTDNTAMIAQKFSSRINYFYQPNAGGGAARNLGVERANGDLFAFLDADDCWTNDKLVLQTNALLANNELDAVFGMVRQIKQSDWHAKEEYETTKTSDLFTGIVPGTMLIRRRMFERVGAFPVNRRVGEFIEWFVRAREIGFRFETLPELMLWRRIHQNNLGVRCGDVESRRDFVRIVKESLDRRAQKQI